MPQAAMSDEDDGRTRKRLRVSRACDPCRRRKERCDGDQPSCQRCTAASRACFYNPYRKRGLRPGYVRTLEILLGLILHAFDGVEEVVLSVLRSRPDQPPPSLGQPRHSLGASGIGSLLELWRKSTALEELQSALDSSEAVEDEELYIQGLDAKLTSTFNAISRQTASGTRTWQTPEEDTSFQSPSPQMQTSITPSRRQHEQRSIPYQSFMVPTMTPTVPSALKLPPNWSHLVDVYIGDTHSWFPVIQKYTLFRTASLVARAEGDSSARTLNQGDVALLWAVFAYSCYQIDVSGLRPANASTSSKSNISFEEVFMIARTMALREQTQYDLGHVHATLTLALLDMRRGSWLNCWLWVGRAVYTANILDVIPNSREMPQDEETRRCFHGCFVLDTLVATRLGFRPYLQRADLARTLGLTDDGPEEWELWRPLFEEDSAKSAVSPGPGRVLSTFNTLCYMTAAIGQYSDDSIHTRPKLHDLVSYLTSRDRHAGLSEPQSEISLSSEPPHILQVKLAAAAAYLRVQNGSISNPMAMDAVPSHNAIRKSVSQIVSIIHSSTSQQPAFNSSSLPPTVQIFTRLLSSPQSNSHAQPFTASNEISAPSGSQSALIQRYDSAMLPSSTSRATMDNVTMLDSMPQVTEAIIDTSTYYDNNNTTTFNNSMATQKLGGRAEAPNKRGNPGSSPAGSRFVPVPTPPLTIQPEDTHQHPLSLSNHETVPGARALNETASDGLFNQLVSLDSSEWPTLSEEFMQHLGLSRDGSLFEFQNLLAPHEAPR